MCVLDVGIIQKSNIRNHFFVRTKPCGSFKNDLVLTDRIKQDVLDNHVYHIPTAPSTQTIINANINTFNQMNNIVNNIDPMEKISKYMKHTNSQIVDFDKHVMDTLETEIESLDTDKDCIIHLKSDALLQLVDSVTRITDFDNMNVVYDVISDKLKIYNEGCWKSYLMEAGISEIIHCIKDTYLDEYECYLLQKWNATTNSVTKSKVSEYITEYLQFLACNDMSPFFIGKTNGNILQTSSQSYDIEETWYKKFSRIKDNLKAYEVRKVRSNIANIIKRNSKVNILDLNKKIMELINVDEYFKREVLASMQHVLSTSIPMKLEVCHAHLFFYVFCHVVKTHLTPTYVYRM